MEGINVIPALVKRFIDWIGWPALLSLLLLAVALGSIAYALAAMLRGAEFEVLLLMTMAGMILGWGLAVAKPVPGWLAALLAAVVGTELVLVRAGHLVRPIYTAGLSVLTLIRQLWANPLTTNMADTQLPDHLTELGLILTALFLRLWQWLMALGTDGPTFEPVVTLIIWGLVLWAASVWAAWGIRRWQRPLLAMTPAGILMATAAAFSLQMVEILLLVMGAMLLLIGLTRHQNREGRWQRNSIDFPADIRLELGVWIAGVTMVLVMTAWLIPSISVQQIATFARDLLGSNIGQVEPALGLTKRRDAQPDPLQEVRSPGLPRRHLLGSGPELSEQVALVINTGQRPVDSDTAEANPPAPRYYWRSLTYDIYTGRGWRTGSTQQIEYEAGETITAGDAPPGRYMLQQTVQILNQSEGVLYATGDLVSANQNFSINWRGPNDAFAATINANGYQASSLVSAATEDELRAAGSNYPDWIQRHYLFLPATAPARIKTLAQDLTLTSLTPYDRAKAIESYLRTFTYTLDLPAPPGNRDIVDYFLFDLQQGYCDYYATSMVVLARAAGLPARMAIGYAPGVYDPEKAHYIVTEADAHSWPEIYFPDYGWIRFEPTAARPASNYSEEAALPEIPDLPAGADLASMNQPGAISYWWLLLPGVILLPIIGMAGWLLIDTLRLRRMAPHGAITAIYRRLYGYAQWLAVPIRESDTPHEFSAALTHRINSANTQNEGPQSPFVAAAHMAQWLTNLYVQTAYSRHSPNPADRQQAIKTWLSLQRQLWRVKFSIWRARVFEEIGGRNRFGRRP